MSCDIRIDSRGLGTVEIPDADGEMRSYRSKLMPPRWRVSDDDNREYLWTILFQRVDSGNEYFTRVYREGSRGERWTCSCPSHTYRKRGAPPCKHIRAGASLRAWITSYLSEHTHIHTQGERHAQPAYQ